MGVKLGPPTNVTIERGILGPKGEEVRGVWREQQDEELHNLYLSPNTY
jgi:hypothetical protein